MGGDLLLEELFGYEPGWDKAILSAEAKGIKRPVLEAYSSPSYRERLMDAVRTGRYRPRPPREALVPKDDGTMRTVYANDPWDRVLMAAVNDALFRLCPDMVHPACMSYRAGIGCGKVAREVSGVLSALDAPAGEPVGKKMDLSKYFDSVPIGTIDLVFDMVEDRLGPSSVLDMLRACYHDDTVLDLKGRPYRKYTSLRQGCAVAAFLADTVLYGVDSALEASGASAWRYSDDILVAGPGWEDAFAAASGMLDGMGLGLNPKKVEPVLAGQWFGFLGFGLRPGGGVTLSKKRVRNFQKAVEDRTFRHPSARMGAGAALSRIARYLYDGSLSKYGYAEGILPVVDCLPDLRRLDNFVLDCLRACATGRTKLGGLGWDRFGGDGAVARGRGRNVRENRAKLPRIGNYVPLSHMKAVLASSRDAYGAYAGTMICG